MMNDNSFCFSSAKVLGLPILQTIWTQIRLLLRSSLIRVHSGCFHGKKYSGMNLNKCSRRNKQTFSGKTLVGERLTFCIQMDFPIQIDRIRMGSSITLYISQSQKEIRPRNILN